MDYLQEGRDLGTILKVYHCFSAQLLRASDISSWLLLVNTFVSIKICLVVMLSYSKDAGPWDFILL